MSALVEAALVANDFSRIEGRTAPTGWLSGVTVETAPAKVLSLLRSGVICMLNEKASVRGKTRKRMHAGGWGVTERSLGGDNDGCGVFCFDTVEMVIDGMG